MNLIQITPGAGGMYCGNCFRDNALVAALRRQGHDITMVPLYLTMTLDEAATTAAKRAVTTLSLMETVWFMRVSPGRRQTPMTHRRRQGGLRRSPSRL